MTTDLSPRHAAVLEAVVRRFIVAGQPVGSGTVAGDLPEAVSSATVRNVMADLERLGYLAQPHTSAGRRPTARGYVAYVHHLMEHGPLQRIDEDRIRERLDAAQPELEALLQRACSVLSEMTRQVGLVLAPSPAETSILHVDLVRQGREHVSVVFVTSGGMVHTRTIAFDEEAPDSDLEAAASFLMRLSEGRTLRQLREFIAGGAPPASRLELLAFRLMQRSLGETIDESTVLVEGTFRLLDSPELAERASLPAILATFEERRQLGRLLTQCGMRPGPQVLIGRDRLPESLGGCALVAAGYRSGSRPLGVLGVFGPARMEYQRTIPMVETMARVTSDIVTRLCA